MQLSEILSLMNRSDRSVAAYKIVPVAWLLSTLSTPCSNMLLSNQQQIENFLEDVWNILDHPDVNVRMAAGEALKGILLLL